MELRITGRHGSMADDVKEYVEEKLAPLAKFNRHARALDIIFDADHLLKTVEVIAHVNHGSPVVVHAKHEDARAAVDAAHDKLERALRRLKERTEDRRRGRGDQNAAVRFATDATSETESSTEEE